MAFVIDTDVFETTTTSGTGDLSLAGAVGGFRAFSVIGDGNTTYVRVKDGQDPLVWEEFIGTYRSSGNLIERTTFVRSSTGSPINWPGSGSRNIFIHPSGIVLASDLFNPTWTTGFPSRSGTFPATAVWNTRVFQLAAGAGASRNDLLTGSNLDGASGNPTFTLAYDPVRAAGGSALQRTITAAVLAGGLTYSGFPFVSLGENGENFTRKRRLGANDYRFDLNVGNSWQEFLTTASVAGLIQARSTSSGSTTGSTVETNTEFSFTVPATGDYFIGVFGIVLGESNAGGGWGLVAEVQENVNAAGYNAVGKYQISQNATAANEKNSTSALYGLSAATNGSTYQYRLSPAASGNGVLYANSGAGELHRLLGIMMQVSS